MAHRSPAPQLGTPPAPARAASAAEAERGLRERLVPPMPGRAAWGWAGPLLVTLFGGFLRFDQLSVPRGLVFDEVYYGQRPGTPDGYQRLRSLDARIAARGAGAGPGPAPAAAGSSPR